MPLDEFDLVYAYPWAGEEAVIMDVLRSHGAPEGRALLQLVSGDLRLMRRDGRVERTWRPPGRSVPAPPDTLSDSR